MNRKEKKEIAQKVAKLEIQLQNCTDSTKRQHLENAIFALLGHVTNLFDMMEIDDMVQTIIDDKH